jgi:hypothetical protein
MCPVARSRDERLTLACSRRGPLRSHIASALPFRLAGHAAEAWSVRHPGAKGGKLDQISVAVVCVYPL